MCKINKICTTSIATVHRIQPKITQKPFANAINAVERGKEILVIIGSRGQISSFL